MTLKTENQPTVIRTERGLTISGTRITLYQLLDYLHGNYPPSFIRHQFQLTEEQFAGAMAYIHAHREEVEQEYQTVLQEAEATQRYWEAQNKELINSDNLPPNREYQVAWQKLQAHKARHKATN